MIHESRVAGVITKTAGAQWVERLSQSDDDMAAQYARIGNRDVAAYLADMANERFFTPQEAVDEGFAVLEADSGLDTGNPSGQTRQNVANSTTGNAMTPEEQARYDAAMAENTRLKAAAEASEKTTALADAAFQPLPRRSVLVLPVS